MRSLTALGMLGLLCGSAAGAAEFAELQWLHPDADALGHLSSEPLECLAPPQAEEGRYLVDVGRQVFRNPLLLKGEAASQGLNCNSCHISGGDNPDFYLEGLSGEPGSVDVSNARFSKMGEDGSSDPLPIPSLVNAGERDSYGSAAPMDSLADYVAAITVDEFQGSALPARVGDALVAYIQALSSTACPEQQQDQVVRSVGHQLYEIARSVDVLQAALARGDEDVLDLLILSTQQQVLRLQRRYDIPDSRDLAGDIARMSRELGEIRADMADQDLAQVRNSVQGWYRGLQGLRGPLLQQADQSLYRRGKLEAWLRDSE